MAWTNLFVRVLRDRISVREYFQMKDNMILEVGSVSKSFGGLKALQEINLSIHNREIVGLIGPNGAGKTTLFNCITGMNTPTAGRIIFKGSIGLVGKRPDEIAKLGMARTFQNIRLFSDMTTLENVMVGRHCRSKTGLVGAIIRSKATVIEEMKIAKKGMELLRFVGLRDYANELAKNLPYGLQRRLEIARALATEPVLLFLDEPAAGMNPQEIFELMHLIKMIRDRGITVILIEHHMKVVMGICERIVVLNYGIKIAEGSADEIKNNPDVIEAYLGKEE